MTTIFEKFKFVFMDFIDKEFTVDEVMEHGANNGIYHGRTTFKNALYRFERNGYVKRVVRGVGQFKSIWKVLPALETAIDFAEYEEVKKEVKTRKELAEKQVFYKHKYDQLTRDYELIEPQEGRKIMETMAHSHDRQKSPRVYVGNLWEMMV